MQTSETVLRSLLISLGARWFLVVNLVGALASSAYLVSCAGTDTRDAVGASQPAIEDQKEEEDVADPEGVAAADRTQEPRGDPKTAAEVLNDVKRIESLQLLEAEHQVLLGDKAYEAADFTMAAEHYKRALALNPEQLAVRQRYNNALTILGKRSGEVRAISVEIADRQKAARQQRLSEAQSALEAARRLVSEERYEAAEARITKVYEEVGIYEDYPTELREDVTELVELIKLKKKEQEIVRRDELERLVRGQKERLREEEEEAEQLQVKELLSRAADYVRFNEWEAVIETCERILKIEPDHTLARFWLRDANEQLFDERATRLILDDLENTKLFEEGFMEASVPYTSPFVFPSDSEWHQVLERQKALEVISIEDPEPIRRIKNLLEVPISISWDEVPLLSVVDDLLSLTGANIGVDPAVNPEDVTVDLRVREMKAINVLKLMLENTGLAYTFRENILLITEKGKATGALEFQIYNVADILNKIRDFQGPTLRLKPSDETEGEGTGGVSFEVAEELGETTLSPDELMELIRDSTGSEEAWGDYNMEFERGLLFVTAPRDIHQEVRKVLSNLRQDSDIFVMIEARFIDVIDDFLQDIGVDYRALGQVSNIGTPFGNIINDNRTGGNDLGFVKQGSAENDTTLITGQDRWAGRIQNIIDGFSGIITGQRLRGGNQGIGGLTFQGTWLDPFQVNAIVRAVEEKGDVRQLTAPTITAANGQRVYVSVITQRAYIADYELVSGGTGFQIIEVADPVVSTFQEGVILDVDPVISPDKKYITLDVRPTMATLIGGVISTILISLGSFTNVAFEVPIGIPQVSLQQSFTSVTVPNGGTVLLGGFKSMSQAKYNSRLPLLGQIPIVKNLFRRQAEISEKRSLVILINARIVNPRAEEAELFNTD